MFQLVTFLSSSFQVFCCLPLIKYRIPKEEILQKCCADLKENGQFANCSLFQVLVYNSDRIFIHLCILNNIHVQSGIAFQTCQIS